MRKRVPTQKGPSLKTQTLRCAVYTRVSRDDGLEQDFNSLDAQREAAEAYVKSQSHDGWILIRDHCDDGNTQNREIFLPNRELYPCCGEFLIFSPDRTRRNPTSGLGID